jgi:hypothetical protein
LVGHGHYYILYTRGIHIPEHGVDRCVIVSVMGKRPGEQVRKVKPTQCQVLQNPVARLPHLLYLIVSDADGQYVEGLHGVVRIHQLSAHGLQPRR